MFVQVFDRLNIFMVRRVFRNGEKSIIPLCSIVFSLFGLQDANEAARDTAARKTGCIHEQQNVQRIAVIALGREKEKLRRKGESYRA